LDWSRTCWWRTHTQRTCFYCNRETALSPLSPTR
jgi:hypothetical protein